jgi:hypothetical protein
MAARCTRKTIKFKTRRGRTITFTGKSGSACPPRRKPSTAHLRPWKAVMKKASPQCARRFGGGTKAFGRCMKDALKSVRG